MFTINSISYNFDDNVKILDLFKVETAHVAQYFAHEEDAVKNTGENSIMSIISVKLIVKYLKVNIGGNPYFRFIVKQVDKYEHSYPQYFYESGNGVAEQQDSQKGCFKLATAAIEAAGLKIGRTICNKMLDLAK